MQHFHSADAAVDGSLDIGIFQCAMERVSSCWPRVQGLVVQYRIACIIGDS